MEPNCTSSGGVSDTPPPGGVESWLVRHRARTLLLIVVLSMTVRVIYFAQLSAGPCIRMHGFTQSDMAFFDEWARTVAAGDWLTDRDMHPQHQWHDLIAELHFVTHPEERAALEHALADADSETTPTRLLWDRWYGGRRFYQEPLYPYLIAATYRVFGADVRWVFMWQLLAGVLTNVLVYLIARRCFGDVVAVVAGGLVLLCGPLLFHELVLLRSSMVTLVGLVLVFWLTDPGLESRSWRPWLLIGLLCGIAILLRALFGLFSLSILVWLLCSPLRQPAQRLRCAAALAGGAALCLLPLLARNLAVGAPPLGLLSGSASTFVCTNAEDYVADEGFYISFKHAPRILGACDGRLLPAVLRTLRTHSGVASYLGVLGEKFAWVWNWYEQPNNVNFYYYRSHASVLRYLPVTFLVLAPVGMVGIALSFRRCPGATAQGSQRVVAACVSQAVRPAGTLAATTKPKTLRCNTRCVPLYLLGVSHLVPLLAFFVVARLRAPLIAILVPFAAFAVVRVVQWWVTGARLRGLLALLTVLLLAKWTSRPLPEQRNLIRYSDCAAAHWVYYDYLEQEARAAEQWERVADVLDEALQVAPGSVRRMGLETPARTIEDHLLASWYANIHQRRAEALLRAGRSDDAVIHQRRAAELAGAAEAFKLSAQDLAPAM
ncbi:MAG: glycosyltransferase family 39 protein [bacterium]|nr:glycosyltransferase family 39 protein [bacterium]